MNNKRHVFCLDVPALRYCRLGDTSVRIIAIHYLSERYHLDPVIVPPRSEAFYPLWRKAFGEDRIVTDINLLPDSHRRASISAPTSLDWEHSQKGLNVFECVMWENGFFDTANMYIRPPQIFHAGIKIPAIMIYPFERTDGNSVYDSNWWIEVCTLIRSKGFSINLLGDRRCAQLQKLFDTVEFDYICAPTIEGLKRCTENSCMAIGSSTGPTWTLLMSDIPQIVLQSGVHYESYWNFDRCQKVLEKRLKIFTRLESLFEWRTGWF